MKKFFLFFLTLFALLSCDKSEDTNPNYKRKFTFFSTKLSCSTPHNITIEHNDNLLKLKIYDFDIDYFYLIDKILLYHNGTGIEVNNEGLKMSGLFDIAEFKLDPSLSSDLRKNQIDSIIIYQRNEDTEFDKNEFRVIEKYLFFNEKLSQKKDFVTQYNTLHEGRPINLTIKGKAETNTITFEVKVPGKTEKYSIKSIKFYRIEGLDNEEAPYGILKKTFSSDKKYLDIQNSVVFDVTVLGEDKIYTCFNPGIGHFKLK